MICKYCEEYSVNAEPRRKGDFDSTCNQCEEYSLPDYVKTETEE